VKKVVFILIGFLLIFILGIVFVVHSQKKPVKEIKKEKKQTVQSVEDLSQAERPVISLTSRSDGNELTLTVENVKNFKIVEYELTYLSEGIQRGVIGSVDLNGKDNFTRRLLLGTCSRGVCHYDKNITGGTLTVSLRSKKTYKFIRNFKLKKEKGSVVVVNEL